ncbi:hypothetical protein D3C80_1797890 [compost metagenome]
MVTLLGSEFGGVYIAALRFFFTGNALESGCFLDTCDQCGATAYHGVGEHLDFRPQLFDLPFKFVPFVHVPMQQRVQIKNPFDLDTQCLIVDFFADIFLTPG